jgi:RimJ/RimL family protein N-acetyltransferase
MPDPAPYVVPLTLRDGTPATLRAARPDDADKIRRAFHQLSGETIHTRFFAHRADVTDAELHRITHCDFRRDVALLITTGSNEDEIVIGGGSAFAVDPATPPASAELAFTIEEDFQGQRLASLLLHHLATICHTNGVQRLEAEILSYNTPMLGVFQHSGLPMILHHEDDTTRIVMDLVSPPAVAPD